MTSPLPSKLDDWKWYIRARDFSIHQSQIPVVDAVEVDAPPNENYTWDWENSSWVIDTLRSRGNAQRHINQEYLRIEKFSHLEADDKPGIAASLAAYRRNLRDYIKNYQAGAMLPAIPEELLDDNFYS